MIWLLLYALIGLLVGGYMGRVAYHDFKPGSLVLFEAVYLAIFWPLGLAILFVRGPVARAAEWLDRKRGLS